MSPDTNQHFARITPVDSDHAGRVLNRWSLICNLALTQSMGILYGFSCSLLPLVVGWVMGLIFFSSAQLGFAIGTSFALIGAGAGIVGLRFYGFPVLLFERSICSRLLTAVAARGDQVISPASSGKRVVEFVPRERWKKRFCLDTATDLMLILVDDRGVWMNGDRYRYELPAESILGAEFEGFCPPSCSFQIYMVIVYVRTEEGTIELPISCRDYRWRDFQNSRRRAQAMELAEQINAVSKGDLYRPAQPPTVEDHPRACPLSNNPYAAPALIHESS